MESFGCLANALAYIHACGVKYEFRRHFHLAVLTAGQTQGHQTKEHTC